MTMAAMPARTRRWTRAEYERLVELGVFRPGERLELVGGDLVVREPQGGPHATAVGLADDALRAAFGAGWIVRSQGPLALDDESEPEPDVTVVAGRRRDYRLVHPSRPALVVEVAESSLAFDRDHKGSLYARAGVADYWIVDLPGRALEVHRDPAPDARAPFGWRYRTRRRFAGGDTVAPLAAPHALVAVADLLP
jgi:Uma2 family endonuclease